MNGKRKKKSLTQNEKRLQKLKKHQAIYHARGHIETPVDGEISDLEAELNRGKETEELNGNLHK